MRNKTRFIFLFLFVSGGFLFPWDINDVNGTWVDDEAYLKSGMDTMVLYYWGRGWTIPNISMDFDLVQGIVRFSDSGGYIIDTAYKDEEGSICLKTFHVGDENFEEPIIIKITFIDYKKAYITHDKWEIWKSRRYSLEEKWVWHRLSGPRRK